MLKETGNQHQGKLRMIVLELLTIVLIHSRSSLVLLIVQQKGNKKTLSVVAAQINEQIYRFLLSYYQYSLVGCV